MLGSDQKRWRRIVLYEDQTPIAELTPLADRRRATLRELCEALAAVPVDEDFASDLQSVNAADQPLDSPWDSPADPRDIRSGL